MNFSREQPVKMTTSEEDLRLIGGEFIIADLPHDLAWLGRYFGPETIKRFVVYYVTFRALREVVSLRTFCQLFIDHTGRHYQIEKLCAAGKKIRELEAAAAKAEKERDLKTLSEIKLGSYIFGRTKDT